MIRYVYAVLLLVAVLAVFSFLNLAWKDVRVETRVVKEDPGKPVSAGVPSSELFNAEISKQLSGATCDIWQEAADVTIRCHMAAPAKPAA